MDADIVNFTVRPLPLSIFPKGGYAGYLEGRPTITFDRLIDETAEFYKCDKRQLKTDFERVEEMAKKLLAAYLANVQFGRSTFLKSYMNGNFDNKKSKFDPSKHKIVMRAICREELAGIDFSKFTFHNNTEGKMLKVTSVNSVGADDDASVTLGLGVEINGDNTNLLPATAGLDPRDRVEFACEMADGTVVTGEAEVLASSIHRITCAWPAALDASAVGGKVTFTVWGRCGEDDAGQQSASTKSVTVLAGETPPVPPTPTGPTVTAINGGTFLEGGGTVVHGENMRFVDVYPGNHVVIKDSEGTDMGAMISTDESIPVTEESFGLTIDAGSPFTEGAEYVFEFSMLDASGQPVTVSQTARYVAE